MSRSAKGAFLTAVVATFFSLCVNSLSVRAETPATPIIPVYPGAVAAAPPAGVAFKALPPQAKTYVTSDDFATVKAWYKAHLKGAQELPKPGMEETEDAFLVGPETFGMVVFIRNFEGRTWIIIGPPA